MDNMIALIVFAVCLAPGLYIFWSLIAAFLQGEVEQAERRRRNAQRHEEFAREKEARGIERVEKRKTLPRKWANEVERELEARRKQARAKRLVA